MNDRININRNLIRFGISLSLLGILIFIMKLSFLAENSIMNLAITIDLLLIVPLVYFLLIRKTEISKTTIVPVMIIGLLIGSYFWPKESQRYLTIFKIWALPIIELSMDYFGLTMPVISVKRCHFERSFKEGYRIFANFRIAIQFFHGGLDLYPIMIQLCDTAPKEYIINTIEKRYNEKSKFVLS